MNQSSQEGSFRSQDIFLGTEMLFSVVLLMTRRFPELCPVVLPHGKKVSIGSHEESYLTAALHSCYCAHLNNDNYTRRVKFGYVGCAVF